MDKKILFFDDEKDIAVILKDNLELFGYYVKLVSSIVDLLEEIEREDIDYDLAIMDIMAPIPHDEIYKHFSSDEITNMSEGMRVGEVLVNRIRQKGKYSNIPVLIYTARSEVKSFSNSRGIKKPAICKDVMVEIEKLLNTE